MRMIGRFSQRFFALSAAILRCMSLLLFFDLFFEWVVLFDLQKFGFFGDALAQGWPLF